MGKRHTKVITIIFCFIFIIQGILVVYKLLNPHINYRHETEVSIEADKEISEVNIHENKLFIPKIGVEISIGKTSDYLDFGGWVQNVNTKDLPFVISIHRFGLDSLTDDMKIHQTLYNADKLQVGDEVKLHWDGKEYIYSVKEIYEGINNKPVKDNELLLYTCKYWSSSERIFVLLGLHQI
jgi:sortase (surface protein transpeptidase)